MTYLPTHQNLNMPSALQEERMTSNSTQIENESEYNGNPLSTLGLHHGARLVRVSQVWQQMKILIVSWSVTTIFVAAKENYLDTFRKSSYSSTLLDW